ncbi:hypothetical protein IC582_010867 [Cucumis melo]
MTLSLALAFSVSFLLLPFSLHAIDELISLLLETTVTIVNEVGGPLLGILTWELMLYLQIKVTHLTLDPTSGERHYFIVFEWVKGQPHYFTIYDFKRDGKTFTNCRWLVYASGPCLQHFEAYVTCFPWNKNAPELKH